MLLALNIRAAATPQMVNMFLIFIVFSLLVGLLIFFVAGHHIINACCPLVACHFQQGACHRKKHRFAAE
jgi:hypothetical protein